MRFDDHQELIGKHALFSPSKSSWLRYTDEQIIESSISMLRASIGTELHDFAASQITIGVKHSSIKSLINSAKTFIFEKYNKEDKKAYGLKLIDSLRYIENEVFESIRLYINDAIGYHMTAEQPLIFSTYFFGTADAISFRDNILHIFDLKTGAFGSPEKHLDQIEIYAAFFCLNYKIKPEDISYDLRIYKFGEVLTHSPDSMAIKEIIDKVVHSNNLLVKSSSEEE